MNHHAKSRSGHSVDWSDPDLQSLLDKTVGWSLDNRGVFSPVPCELHIGWGAGAVRQATLVYERDGVMVIEASFIMQPGEQVRIDRMQVGALRSSWGTVAEARAGCRNEDLAHGIHVYWVHTR